MAPRIRPMPSEKKRVIWSAPTNVLPVAQRLLAQERAPTDLVPERVQRRLVRTVGERAGAPPTSIDFVLGVVGDPVEALAEPGQRAGQRPRGELEPRLAVGAQPRDLVEHRRDGGPFEPVARGVERAFGDRDDLPRRSGLVGRLDARRGPPR